MSKQVNELIRRRKKRGIVWIMKYLYTHTETHIEKNTKKGGKIERLKEEEEEEKKKRNRIRN